VENGVDDLVLEVCVMAPINRCLPVFVSRSYRSRTDHKRPSGVRKETGGRHKQAGAPAFTVPRNIVWRADPGTVALE